MTYRGDDGTNRFDGWGNYPGVNVGGTYADTFVYSPWVKNRDVSAWAMLDNTTIGPYAQIGWREAAYSERHTFVEEGVPTAGYFLGKDLTAESAGSWHYYGTLVDYDPGYFTLQVDGKTWQRLPKKFVPDEAQQFGENQTSANQMPGGYRNNEVFAGAHV